MIIDEKLMLDVLAKHSSEIAGWMNEEIVHTTNNVCPEVDPVKGLPAGLQQKLRNKRAFRRAYADNWIYFAYDGRIASNFKSQRELTYFCGRCFCCDTVVGRLLLRGKYCFPTRELEMLFGVNNMRDSRKKLLKSKIPKHYKVIDALFDTCF